jgi:hypothetical protein
VDDDARREEIARRLGGEVWAKQVEFITNPFVRLLARGVGVDMQGIDEQHRAFQRDVAALLQAAIWFAPLGWYVSANNLRASDYAEAVEAWEARADADEVDRLLARAWHDMTWLRHSYNPITTLAGRHEPTQRLMRSRLRLMDKAVTHHMAGAYEASTLIVLSQVDGLTYDLTDGAHGFFYRGKDHFFEDDTTLAGMPEFLRTVRHAVNRDIDTTSDATAFHRTAIVHGRYPEFGTEVNSAKAFALMAGVVEWLTPRAAQLTERWQAEDEARWAGSMERDASGRLRDRRGFSETREGLRWLALRQSSYYRDHSRYSADLLTELADKAFRRMQRGPATTMTVSPDGQTWWASCRSDTPIMFGIGGRNGEPFNYLYVGEGAPGPLDEDGRWVSELDDDTPPDWEG